MPGCDCKLRNILPREQRCSFCVEFAQPMLNSHCSPRGDSQRQPTPKAFDKPGSKCCDPPTRSQHLPQPSEKHNSFKFDSTHLDGTMKRFQEEKKTECQAAWESQTSSELRFIPSHSTATGSRQPCCMFPCVIMLTSLLLPCVLQHYLYWFNDPLSKYCTLGSATLLRNDYSFPGIQRC